MSRSDQRVPIILTVAILLHLSVLIIAIAGNKLPWLIILLNFLSALSVIIYWAGRKLRIQQHFFEFREMVMVCFEVIVACSAGYMLISGSFNDKLRIVQYLFLGFHLVSLLLFLVFMVTFKWKKLI